jgi:hypothetical protein
MYRIFCESYENYAKSFTQADARLDIASPFNLIADNEKFNIERQKKSNEYKELCDMLYHASQSIEKYPSLKAFLWTISSRGMMPLHFGVSGEAVLEEQVKLLNSFLKLAYWE